MFNEKFTVKAPTDEEFKRILTELNDYFNEDKCAYVLEISKELLKRNDGNCTDFAKELLTYAEKHYLDVDDASIKAEIFLTLARLYEEKIESFDKAYEYYEKFALSNTKYGNTACILTKALLLKDSFTYSDELEKQLLRSYGEPDLGLRTDRFYETAANYLVAKSNKKDELSKKYRDELLAIEKADELMFLDLFFKKDDVRDILTIPDIAKEFLKALKAEKKAEREAAEKAKAEKERQAAENALSNTAETDAKGE